jgi:hypothetical protein
MKLIPLLLIPSIALLVSACAPAGPTYVSGGGGGYVGGDDGSGYYGPGGVWIVETGNPRDHDSDYYHHNVTNVNDVNINRTTENERTVNQTNVNRTNVNQKNIAKKNVRVSSKNQVRKTKPIPQGQNGQGQGNQ